MRRERTGRPIGELLPEVFRRGGMVRGVRRAEAVLLWPHVVGPDVARFSTAVALVNGALVVDVPDPETALHLGMHRHHVLAAYRDRLGQDLVRELRFRVGRPDAPAPPPPPERARPVDPDAMASLARGLAGLDEAVAGPALQAGRALLALRAERAAAGWRPCPVCGVPAEPPEDPHAERAGWCTTCRRHALATRVRTAAERLADHPDDPCPHLTEEERAVATLLAVEALRAASLDLLALVLGDGSRRPELERAVRAVAVLALGRDAGDADLDGDALERLRGTLDDRVLRALAGGAVGGPARSGRAGRAGGVGGSGRAPS